MQSDFDKISAAILTVGRLATSRQGGPPHNWIECYYDTLAELRKREEAREMADTQKLAADNDHDGDGDSAVERTLRRFPAAGR